MGNSRVLRGNIRPLFIYFAGKVWTSLPPTSVTAPGNSIRSRPCSNAARAKLDECSVTGFNNVPTLPPMVVGVWKVNCYLELFNQHWGRTGSQDTGPLETIDEKCLFVPWKINGRWPSFLVLPQIPSSSHNFKFHPLQEISQELH